MQLHRVILLTPFLAAANVCAEPMTVPSSQVHLNGYTATLTPTTWFSHDVFTVDMSTATPTGAVFMPPGVDVYNNVPTALGGAGSLVTGQYAFMDWVGSTELWMDYVTLDAPGTITHLVYTYIGGTASGLPVLNTHEIFLYSASAPPPNTTLVTYTGVGTHPFASIVLPSLPGTIGGGFVQVVITGLSIPLTAENLCIAWDEGGLDDVFWLTGGRPGMGTSTDSIIYYDPVPPGPPPAAAYVVLGPLQFNNGDSMLGNVSFALGVPEPATIGVLVVGGLLALRRGRDHRRDATWDEDNCPENVIQREP